MLGLKLNHVSKRGHSWNPHSWGVNSVTLFLFWCFQTVPQARLRGWLAVVDCAEVFLELAGEQLGGQPLKWVIILCIQLIKWGLPENWLADSPHKGPVIRDCISMWLYIYVIIWKHTPHYCPFVRGIDQSTLHSYKNRVRSEELQCFLCC